MNEATAGKTRTAVTLSDKEMGMLEAAQEAGRGLTLLSQLTFSKKQMTLEGPTQLKASVASGISSTALDAFSKFARIEILRSAGKSAMT